MTGLDSSTVGVIKITKPDGCFMIGDEILMTCQYIWIDHMNKSTFKQFDSLSKAHAQGGKSAIDVYVEKKNENRATSSDKGLCRYDQIQRRLFVYYLWTLFGIFFVCLEKTATQCIIIILFLMCTLKKFEKVGTIRN